MYQYHTLNMIAIFLILLLCSKPILSKLFVDPNFASKDISCCKTKSSLSKSQQYISFHPQSLKFTDIPTLTIRENRFEIWNDCDCNNLVIEHIFSRKNDITIASKKDGVILTKDRKKVSIKVLYHPRYPESVDDIIEVQTSRGNFTYSIRASSLQNIFNVEPVEITGDIFRLQVFNPSNTSSLVVQRLFTENEFLFLRPPVQPDSFDSGEDQRLHKWLKSFNAAADASQVWTVPTLQRRDVAEISARSSTPGPQEGFVHLHLDNTKLVIPVSTNVSALPADAELTRETSPSLSPSASPLEPLTNNSTIGEMGPIAYWPYFVDFGTLGVIDSLQSIPVYMTTSGSSYARIMSTRVDSDNTRNNITVHLLRNVLYAPKLKPSKMCDKNDLTCMAIAVGSNSTDRMLRTRYLDQVVSSNRQLVAYVDFELTSTISGFVSGSVSFAVLIGDGLNPINVSIPFRAVLLLGGIGLSNSATHFVLPISNRTYFPHPFDPSYQTSPGSAVNIINGKQFCGALQGDVPNKTGKKKGKKSIVVSEISRDCVVNGRGDCVGNSDRQILLSFTNYYDQPLLLVDASVSSCGRDDWPPLFSVTHIDRSMVAKGGEKWPDIELQFDMKAALLLQETYPRDLPFVCYLSLRTSVSEHMIPLFVTDGAVKLVHVNAMKIEDPNSLATIVGPTLGSSSMKGRCAPSVTLNSDINYINMFYMLESRPRPLRVVYANNNPYSIPMILSSASSDMCFCVDQIWPITSDLSSVDFLKFNLNTVITELSSFAESLNSDRCTCFVNNATKWLGKEDKLITIHIASYHFISAFVFLPNIDSHLDSDSSGSSHVVSFALESQHQLIKTKMSFQSQSGQLHSSLAHGVVPSWTIGRPNSLDINFSFATPGISLDWMSRVWYRVVPMPNTRAASHILSLVENKVNLVSGNLSWVGSLRPLDLCRMQLMSMLDEAPLVLLTSSEIQAETAPAPELSMFYCLYDMLSRVDGDASVTTVMNQLRAVQTELHNGNAISGFEEILRLRSLWETTWRGDVSPLSTVPVNVLLYTPIGSYVHLVPSIQIKTTLISAPERYLLRLPNTTTNQLTVVYLRVKNPFNMPVHFRIKTFDSYFPSTIASNLNILSPSPNLETMQSDYFYLKSSFQMHDSNTTVASSQSPSQKPSSRLKSKRRSAYIVPTMGGFSSVSGRIVSEKAAADKDAATSSPSISRRRPIPVETKRSVLSIDPMFAWERFVGNEVIPDEAFVIGARSRIVPLTKSQIQEISGSTDQAVFAHPDAAYLAAPLESFLLGPVFFVPTLSVDVASAVVQYADIYLVNSFSGVDKVEVATVIGNPFLRLESLQVASHGSLQSVDVVASKKLHVDFNSSIDTVHISIANDGFTPTTITDVIIDGVSCKRKKSNAAIVCRGIKLPRYLVEDSMWTFDINGLSSCNYRARDHSVVLEMIPLTPADDAEDNSNFSSLEIKFSSRLQASCKYEIRNSRIFWTVLVLVIGALITWAFMEFMKYSAIEDNSANSKQKKVKKKIVSALPTIQAPLAGAHLEPLLVPINTKRSEITPARSTGSSPRDDASKASLSAREYLPVSPGPLSSLLRLTPDPSYLLTNARKGIDEPIVVTSKRTRKRLVKERKAIGSPEAASGLESPPASNTPSPRSTTNSQASPKIPLNFISLVDSLAREIPLEIVTSVETEIQFDAFIDSGPTSLESIHMDKKDFKVEDFKVDIPEMHEDTSETVESPVEDESSVEPIVLSPDIDNCAENFHFIDPETEIASDFSSEHINMATSVDVEHSDLTPKIVHSLALEREESESPLRLLPNDLSDVKEAGESSPSISGPPPGLESTQHVQVTPDYRSSQSSLFYRSLSRPFAPVSSENVTAHVGPSITDIYNATGSETFSSFDYDIRTPNLSVKESVPFTSSPKRANLGSSNAYYEPEPRIQSSINFGGYEFVSTGSVPISAIASTDVRRAPPAQLRVSPISDHPYRQPAMIPYQAPFRHQSDLSVNASLSQNRHQMPSDFSRPSDEMLFPGESSLRPSMHSQSFVSQLSSNIHGQQQQQQQRPIFTPQNQNWPPETMSTSSASLDQDTYLQMEGQLKYLGLDDDYDDDDGDDSKK